ncbi:hypothetical protein SLE2022_269190 [Rubroshorea leprosula]
MGGGDGSNWCANHIKAVVNIGGPFLGVPKAVTGLFSVEARDIVVARSFAPAVLDKDVFGFQTLLHIMQMTRSWDSTMSMIPKGGETIWVGLDWSPERGFNCAGKRLKNNYTHNQNANESFANTQNVNYGRIISFGKDVAELHSAKFESVNFRNAVKGNEVANSSRCDVWTEYHEMGFEGIRAVADNKVYTAESILDLLHFVAPNLMAGGETKLPNAPDMEIYSMYGVGIPTEREHMSTN